MEEEEEEEEEEMTGNGGGRRAMGWRLFAGVGAVPGKVEGVAIAVAKESEVRMYDIYRYIYRLAGGCRCYNLINNFFFSILVST